MTWDWALWRKESPLAAPIATFILTDQDRGCGPPVKYNEPHQSQCKTTPMD